MEGYKGQAKELSWEGDPDDVCYRPIHIPIHEVVYYQAGSYVSARQKRGSTSFDVSLVNCCPNCPLRVESQWARGKSQCAVCGNM